MVMIGGSVTAGVYHAIRACADECTIPGPVMVSPAQRLANRATTCRC
jgi:hypothetical protein